MGELGKHLDFRTSIRMEADGKRYHVYSSTVIWYNNGWGRLYFFPVKPFHKLIIRTMMKIMKTKLQPI